MKKILTFLFLILSVFGYAQIEIADDSVYKFEQPSVFEIAAKSNITNNSEDTSFLFVRYQFEDCGLPETAFCDQSLCYATDDDSAYVTIQKNESFDLKVNFYPYDNQGCCAVKMYVISTTDPNNADSCYYEVCTVNSTKTVKRGSLKIHYDQSSDWLSVFTDNPSDFDLSIYNILGEELVSETAVFNGDQISTLDLKKGLYVIKVDGEYSYSGTFRKL